MAPLPGCDIYFKSNDKELYGAMKKDKCLYPISETNGELLYSWTQMRLEKDAFSYLDGLFFSEDDSLAYEISSEWYRFDKTSQ